MDVDVKLLLIEWHRDIKKLDEKMDAAETIGDGTGYYKYEAEHGRLYRCIDSLEAIVYEHVSKPKNNEQEAAPNVDE